VAPEGKPTDRRRQRRGDQRRLIAIVVAFLVIGGAATIALVYGTGAAALGLVCLLSGAGVLLLVWGILGLLERFAS
jgi:hypothetical protein